MKNDHVFVIYVVGNTYFWIHTWTVATGVRAFLTPSDTTCTTGCIARRLNLDLRFYHTWCRV